MPVTGNCTPRQYPRALMLSKQAVMQDILLVCALQAAQVIISCRITTHHLLFCIAPLRPRCSIKRDINAHYTVALLDLSPSGSRYESTVLRQTHLHTHSSAAILGRYCTHHNLRNTSLPSLATFITMERHQSPRHCHSPLYRLVNSSISFRRPSASAQPRLQTSI